MSSDNRNGRYEGNNRNRRSRAGDNGGNGRDGRPRRVVARRGKGPSFRPKLMTKIRLILAVFLALIVFLSYKIVDIKDTYGAEYEQQAILQLISAGSGSEQLISPNRGLIVDRTQEKALAISEKIYDVFVDVRVLINQSEEVREASAAVLTDKLGIAPELVAEYLESMPHPDSTDVTKPELISRQEKYDTHHLVVAEDIDRGLALELQELAPRCIYLDEGTRRVYPEGVFASNTVGFMRSADAYGLEKQYNSELSGMSGRIFREFISSGQVQEHRVEAVDGYTVVTNIDYAIQDVCEDLVVEYGLLHEAENASLLVMNPDTGELLASASYPSFDPNTPSDFSKSTKPSLSGTLDEYDAEDLNTLWSDFNISESFEPGSIFKPIVVAAALDEGVITPADRFQCDGYKYVADVRINCHKLSGHGNISLSEALSQSCNVALMEIAEKMGRSMFYEHHVDFGFGGVSGIDLPNEINTRSLIFTEDRLNPVELATSSFGQRFNCSPIQVLNSFASLINGGNLMRPYVVSRVINENNELVLENEPQVNRKVVSEETSDYMRNAMREVVMPGGTGRGAYIENYDIGGKTGTGEQGVKDSEDYHYVISIITYFPAEDPEYIALGIIKRPKEYVDGETSASPMVKDLMEAIIREKGIRPQGDGQSVEDIKAVTGLISIPDLVEMDLAEATRILNGRGFDYELMCQSGQNSGSVVTYQFPPAGEMVQANGETSVMLHIENRDGSELVEIPNITGMAVSAAERTLREAELVPVVFYDGLVSDESPLTSLGGSDSETEDYVDDYIVYQQLPRLEKPLSVPKGTSIKLKAELIDDGGE